MKKILMFMILIALCTITTSCFGSSKKTEYDPTYYGETYGPMKIIDGLQVCLRTDGYYQVIGITNEAVHDGVVVIPQHINGIPVMGLGIPLHESYPAVGIIVPEKISYIAQFIYREGKNIPLEKYSNGHMVDIDINYHLFFSTTFLNNRINKIYISCHHMNDDPYTINSKVREEYKITINSYNTPAITTEDTDFLLIQNHEIKNARNRDLFEIDYRSYFAPSYYVINQYQYNEFLVEVDKYLLHYAEKKQFTDEEDKKTKIEAERQRVISLFQAKISNVEFHYNLMIDGVEYHNENNFSNDLYWIDYLSDGELLMEPPAPYIEGYDFNGWFKDSECSTQWNFNEDVFLITEEEPIVYLYAGWSKK